MRSKLHASNKKGGLAYTGDIAFAGFNNDPLTCIIEPNLTTVNYKGYEMGQVAAKLLIDRLYTSDNHSKTDVLLQHELIVSESSLHIK